MPKQKTISRVFRENQAKEILADYKKQTGQKTAIVRYLSEKFKVSESTIWNILRDAKKV